MPTKPTQLRIPPELLAQIDAEAQQQGLSRTAWLLKAAQAALPGVRAGDAPSVATHRCPTPGCSYTAQSSNAVCGVHTRRVV